MPGQHVEQSQICYVVEVRAQGARVTERGAQLGERAGFGIGDQVVANSNPVGGLSILQAGIAFDRLLRVLTSPTEAEPSPG